MAASAVPRQPPGSLYEGEQRAETRASSTKAGRGTIPSHGTTWRPWRGSPPRPRPVQPDAPREAWLEGPSELVLRTLAPAQKKTTAAQGGGQDEPTVTTFDVVPSIPPLQRPRVSQHWQPGPWTDARCSVRPVAPLLGMLVHAKMRVPGKGRARAGQQSLLPVPSPRAAQQRRLSNLAGSSASLRPAQFHAPIGDQNTQHKHRSPIFPGGLAHVAGPPLPPSSSCPVAHLSPARRSRGQS